MKTGEQPRPMADHEEQRARTLKQRQEASPQFQAFKTRVNVNLAVPYWDAEALQFYIQHPDLISEALRRGFSNRMSQGKWQEVRKDLERYIWGFPVRTDSVLANDPKMKQLIIWFLRQSKELMEPITLHYSPGCSGEGEWDTALLWPYRTAFLLDSMKSACGLQPNLYHFFQAEGVFLCLNAATSGRVSTDFFFTRKHYCRNGARRLAWADAMKGIESVKVPKYAQ